MAEAYKSAKFEDIKQMYLEREPFISITPKIDVEEIKTKVREEISQQTRQLQTLVNAISAENIDLRNHMQKTEIKRANLEKLIREKLA
jgi:hypothetical protein